MLNSSSTALNFFLSSEGQGRISGLFHMFYDGIDSLVASLTDPAATAWHRRLLR